MEKVPKQWGNKCKLLKENMFSLVEILIDLFFTSLSVVKLVMQRVALVRKLKKVIEMSIIIIIITIII